MKAVSFIIDDYQTLTCIAEEFIKKNVVFTVALDSASVPHMRFLAKGGSARVSFYKWAYSNDVKNYVGGKTKHRVHLVAFCQNRVPAVVRRAQALMAAEYFCRGAYDLNIKEACARPIPCGEILLSDKFISHAKEI